MCPGVFLRSLSLLNLPPGGELISALGVSSTWSTPKPTFVLDPGEEWSLLEEVGVGKDETEA